MTQIGGSYFWSCCGSARKEFDSIGRERGKGEQELTRSSLGPLAGGRLKLADRLAEGLVSGHEHHDGKEREDEGERRVDVPPPVDDAEVLGVPCEEHLNVDC